MQAGECEVSLSLSLYEAEEPDTGERFAVVPGRWMCATPTRGNRGPTSTACLSLSVSPPCDARLPFYCHLPLRLRRGYPTRFVLCNEGQGEEDRR